MRGSSSINIQKKASKNSLNYLPALKSLQNMSREQLLKETVDMFFTTKQEDNAAAEQLQHYGQVPMSPYR